MKKLVDLYDLMNDAETHLANPTTENPEVWNAILSFLTCYIGEDPILEDTYELPVTGDITPLTEEELEQLNK